MSAAPDVDIAIVGGGVIGLAVASRLTAAGRSLVLFEQHESFGQEASSRNSEVIHAGIYYAPGSLKARLAVKGRRSLYAFAEEHNIPYRKCGKVIVAVTEEEVASLNDLLHRGQENEVEGLRLLTAEEVTQREPHIAAAAGLLSPETGIIDSHQLMATLAKLAEQHGADLVFGATVTGLSKAPAGWEIRYRDSAEEGTIAAGTVVNAAGLHSQDIMCMAGLDPNRLGLTRHMAKGEYFSVSGPSRKKVRGLVYPSPEADLVGLGIHTVIDLGGGVKLGPNAFYVEEIDYRVDESHRTAFHENAAKYLPFLQAEELMPDMAGIRAKLSGPGEPARDFYIAHEADHGAPGFLNLAGIESPGLTASLAIADHVADLIDSDPNRGITGCQQFDSE